MTTYDWASLMAQAGTAMEPLPPQEYDVQIINAESKPSSTGKLMIVARMQVLGGPHAGRPVWNNFTLSPENPQALGFFFQHMRTLGLDAAFFNNNPAPETVAEALKGRTCRVKLGIRNYQGSPRNNVERLMPSQAGAAGVPQLGAQPGGPPPVAPGGIAPLPPPTMAPPQPPGVPQPPMPPQAPAPAPAPAPMPPQAPAVPQPPAPPQPPAAPVPQQPQAPTPPMPPAPPGAPVAPPAPPAPPTPPAPPVPQAPPAPPAPEPEPELYTDPATGQRWDGQQWLPPANGAPAPAPAAPQPAAAASGIPTPPF